jgi:hypothetical protein
MNPITSVNNEVVSQSDKMKSKAIKYYNIQSYNCFIGFF